MFDEPAASGWSDIRSNVTPNLDAAINPFIYSDLLESTAYQSPLQAACLSTSGLSLGSGDPGTDPTFCVKATTHGSRGDDTFTFASPSLRVATNNGASRQNGRSSAIFGSDGTKLYTAGSYSGDNGPCYNAATDDSSSATCPSLMGFTSYDGHSTRRPSTPSSGTETFYSSLQLVKRTVGTDSGHRPIEAARSLLENDAWRKRIAELDAETSFMLACRCVGLQWSDIAGLFKQHFPKKKAYHKSSLSKKLSKTRRSAPWIQIFEWEALSKKQEFLRSNFAGV